MVNIPFGEWLTRELAKRNMRPADLGRLSGLDSAVVSNLMSGKRNPGTKTSAAIAKALDMSVDEVLQAAGLTQSMSDDPLIKSVVTILKELRHDDIVEVLEYVRLRKKLTQDANAPKQRRPPNRDRGRTVPA